MLPQGVGTIMLAIISRNLLSHLHPGIIHFPIVLFLLTALARVFSQKVPSWLIRLGLWLSIIFGLLALFSGLIAGQPQLFNMDSLLSWHLRLASLWMGCVLYLTLMQNHEAQSCFTTLIWVAASLLIVATATAGGIIVHS